MKKLLVLLLLLPLAASARMFPSEFPIKAVCWGGENSVEEAITYHQDVLGEYPIGKGWVSETSFGAIMYNPVKPSWTFLSFHQHEEAVIVCAITGGTQWEVLSPGEDKIIL
jgi:hypothetical protein